MITVHHLGMSQSERVVWLFEELEIPYNLKIYDRDPATRRALDPLIAPSMRWARPLSSLTMK